MRRLIHFCLQPASRKLRLLLREKSLDFELQSENFWERRDELFRLNPACEVPVLIESDGKVIAEPAIPEYLEEVYPEPGMLGSNAAARAGLLSGPDLVAGKMLDDIVTDRRLLAGRRVDPAEIEEELQQF